MTESPSRKLFVSEELFYQLGLRQFGDFSRLRLQPPPSVRTLVDIAVRAEESTEGSSLSKKQIVDVSTNCYPSVQFSAELITSVLLISSSPAEICWLSIFHLTSQLRV